LRKLGGRKVFSPALFGAARLATFAFLVCLSSYFCSALFAWPFPVRLAMAAPFDPQGQDWEGLSQLVRIAQGELGSARVVVTSALSLGELKREDGVLMVHPDRTLDVDEIASFMRAGGRLVLLDDYGTGEELLTRFGIRRVPLPARPAEMLRDNPSLAIAEPASVHPTVRDVAHVVTNHATGLEHQALSPLLVVRGDGEPDVLLAVAGAVGHGRFIAIGDASIPINAMMRYPGNRTLSRALIRYATDDDVWGKRGGTLYVVANGFRTTGAFGDSARADTAAREARRAILEALETLRREGLPPGGTYFAALGVGIGVVAWTSARVGRKHRPVSPKFVRPVPAALQGGVAGHAAVLGSPHASRVLAILELKSALEEQLATRLGLEHVPPRDELVAKVRAAGLVDEGRLRALSDLLEELGRAEVLFTQNTAIAGAAGRIRHGDAATVRSAKVLAVAAQVRALLDMLGNPHDRVGRSP
jgi:hypothetical protein